MLVHYRSKKFVPYHTCVFMSIYKKGPVMSIDFTTDWIVQVSFI